LALIALVALAGNRCHEAPGTFDADLSVDDTDAQGAVGDDRLSLAEAVRLANGTLPLDALSAVEREHVSGTPGPASSDRIRVVLSSGTLIHAADSAPPGEPVVPYLLGNDGDLLDGGGAALAESPDSQPGQRTGMLILSSDVRVRGFVFDGLRYGVIVVPPAFLPELSGVAIEGNVFRNNETGVIANASPGVAGTLRRLSIERNTFFPSEHAPNSIVVVGAAPQAAGEVISGALVEDLSIRDNRVHGGFEGISVLPGLASPDTRVEGVTFRNVVVEGNVLDGVIDISLNLAAGTALNGGHVEDTTLEDVIVGWNRVQVGDTGATPIWVASGVVTGSPGGESMGNLVRGLGIVSNRVDGINCFGIALHAGHVELTDGGHSLRNEISDVLIQGNRVHGCENGVALIGGVAAASGGVVEENSLRQVMVTGNELAENAQGLNVIGAAGGEGTTIPGDFDQVVALAARNRVEALRSVRNRIRGSQVGMNFTGGISFESPDVVVDNRVESVSIGPNRLRGNLLDCYAADDIVVGDEGGEASGNAAPVSCN